MIFNTAAYYLLFLLPCALAFRRASSDWRPWIIALFGGAFFIYFSITALGEGWFGAACVGIFIWESLFSRLYSPKARICLLGVAASVLFLGVFKYWNFFTGLVLGPRETNHLYWAGAFLPLGISFFTFEFIHYAVDRYKGKTEAGTLGEYLAFIFFFPTMVAGPIKRYQDFLPCLRNPNKDWVEDWNRGITRILWGLAKKFVLADSLTAFTDHLNQKDIATAPREVLLLWLFAYGWKIYFDFSAYSDIAIGSGRLFGIKIPENFSWPYFQTNITAFWRHWHMSLNKWLIDYVFIPLGGSRGTQAFICRNLLIVMLVSGIWHGAGVNFIVWGLWHGVLLIIHRLWAARLKESKTERVEGKEAMGSSLTLSRVASWALTYIFVNLGWAFFVMDMPTATFYFQRLLGV